MRDSPAARVRWHLTHPLPLLKQLVLRTESHAYSAGLAFFALVGFYPFCLLLLWVSGDLLHWSAGQAVIREALREYYPQGQDFLLRNLDASVEQHKNELTLASALWILVGAAGVFIPLETALNTFWGVREHRPYWRNQLVGFLLTTACVALAFLFVLLTAGLEQLVAGVEPRMLRGALSYGVLRATALALAVVAIYLLFQYLPNRSVRGREVLPAAIAAGVVAEAVRYVYLLVLPHLDLSKSQGPYHVSVSFALLAYFEAFVLMGGAFVAARPAGGDGAASSAES